jgi:hypothetical protein
VLAVASALLLAAAPPAPIIRSGPEQGAQLTRSSATFEFRAPSARPYLYECKIGGRSTPFQDCSRGTFTATGLAVGTHTFSVRTSENDDVSETVERTWTITAIDDDADGSAIPADCNDANPAIFPGATEIAGNGVDENCDGIDAPTVAATPIPVTPAAPAPTPVPTPTPDTRPKLEVTLSYFMRASKRDTRFSTLSLKGVPSGATITIKCTGGCPRKRATITGKRGTVALAAFRNRAIKAGAKLTIEVTKPGAIGTAKVVTIRSSKRPSIATKTLR